MVLDYWLEFRDELAHQSFVQALGNPAYSLHIYTQKDYVLLSLQSLYGLRETAKASEIVDRIEEKLR